MNNRLVYMGSSCTSEGCVGWGGGGERRREGEWKVKGYAAHFIHVAIDEGCTGRVSSVVQGQKKKIKQFT